jgi:hypothetical protein
MAKLCAAASDKHTSAIIFPLRLSLLFGAALSFLCSSCQQNSDTLFQLLPSELSGIRFANTISEHDTLNVLKLEYIYNGGGVAAGDFNKDGLQDLYFTGNMVSNKLYLNQGDMKFKDITEVAGITGEGKWSSGVAVADINGDGWLDMYVCATVHADSGRRANMLYINNGLNQEGIPTFTESAAAFGLADTGHSTSAAFFDYDLDGDLDLYVLTNQLLAHMPNNYKYMLTDGSSPNNDRLYRNNGNGTFSNISKEAGILMEGYGLGLAVSDINRDGWPDLYITNDYLSEDLLYINNGDGTFSNKIKQYIKHTSASAMGNDVVDINNDGLVDIIAMDMLPESNKRKKTMLNANNYVTYINNEKFDIQHQYIRNTLQLNNGAAPDGEPTFSEIGQLAGIYQTDWSWAPLVADFDNDGQRDLIVTNGFPRDVTDHDFIRYRGGPAGTVASNLMLVDSIPVVKTSNYGFRNNGDLTFTDKTGEWGLNIPSFSNGAVYADLDNDGDLDVVVNNINDPAMVYQNRLYEGKAEKKSAHYLRLKLEGEALNQAGLGAKVSIHYGGGRQQFYEHSLYRGYLSSVEASAHFGLGTFDKVDSVQVVWSDGRYQLLQNIPVNQQLIVRQVDARKRMPVSTAEISAQAPQPALFQEVSAFNGIAFRHQEDDKIDFNIQRTMPHKYSQNGPGLAVGDVDGNDLDDFYVGGSAGMSGALFLQTAEGTFLSDASNTELLKEKPEEDLGALFFDADGDGDPDLYVVSGSYEYEQGAAEYQDRLYRNNGQGQFTLDTAALPEIRSSGASVKAADFDRDGDLDLFVGGRVVPGQYPMAPQSYILRNEGGRFTDATAEVCPELEKFGMIADALWTDFDQDGQIDLLVAAEWQPLSFFKNVNGTFKNITSSSGIGHLKGWWNSLAAGDFDGDGDLDYIAGNLGLNTHYRANEQQPLRVHAKDFDENGRMDAILSCYMKAEDGQMKPFPMHTRDDLISQMIRVRRQFQRYGQYGRATIDQVLSEEDLQGALVLEANHFASTYIENQGNGTFRASALPQKAQLAPVYGMLSRDFDGDGKLDVLMVGNSYATEVFTGRYDASIGLFMKGDGKGGFRPQPVASSGFFLDGDAKGLTSLYGKKGEELFIVSQNQDSLRMFTATYNSARRKASSRLLPLKPLDARAEIHYRDGRSERREFYYGSTYLSQSSRRLSLGPEVVAVTLFDFKGNSRSIQLNHQPDEATASRANK